MLRQQGTTGVSLGANRGDAESHAVLPGATGSVTLRRQGRREVSYRGNKVCYRCSICSMFLIDKEDRQQDKLDRLQDEHIGCRTSI